VAARVVVSEPDKQGDGIYPDRAREPSGQVHLIALTVTDQRLDRLDAGLETVALQA
jgi:hypothetical protein